MSFYSLLVPINIGGVKWAVQIECQSIWSVFSGLQPMDAEDMLKISQGGRAFCKNPSRTSDAGLLQAAKSSPKKVALRP